MTLTRISITIPRDLVTKLDRRAKELDRSRSWVIAEAARRYLDGADATTGRATARVSETNVPYVAPGLGPSRQAQLQADLALTPEERVRAAQRTARAGRARWTAGPERLLTFERYEDYIDWKRREGILW